MNRIIYIMGKSATGKDTIFQHLQKKHPEWKMMTLYTTRPIRVGETDGKEYYFVDDNYIEEIAAQGKIIEQRTYDTVHGLWHYVTADDGKINLQQHTYLAIGTLQSYLALRRYYGSDALLPVYIEVEDGERLERALRREKKQADPKYGEMCRRFLGDSEDFSEEKLKEAGIHTRFQNVHLKDCIHQIEEYLAKTTLP